jgi:hypothetical protein
LAVCVDDLGVTIVVYLHSCAFPPPTRLENPRQKNGFREREEKINERRQE